MGADANGERELTATEAQRLAIRPRGVEEMDRNKDGRVTRFEYQETVGR